MGSTQHRSFEKRFVIEAANERDAGARTLARLLAFRPTDRLECDATRLRYHLDPPWFMLLVVGAALGLGVVCHIAASRLGDLAQLPATITLRPGPRLLGVWVASLGAAIVMDVLAVLALASFLWSRARSFTVERRGNQLAWTHAVGRYVLSSGELHAGDAIATLVVRRGMRREAVLVGPRNVEIVRLARERWTDPTSLVDWIAEATAAMLSRPHADDGAGATAEPTSAHPATGDAPSALETG